jgi:hypothetical protein
MNDKNTNAVTITISRKRKRDEYEKDNLVSFLHFEIKSILTYIEGVEKLMSNRIKRQKTENVN